jgi:hypothetical protein
MSHVVQSKTCINDKDMLKKTLKEMGIEFKENAELIDYYSNNAGKIDFLLTGISNSVGYLKNGDVYDFKGDTYFLKDKNILKKIEANFTKNILEKKLRSAGAYSVAVEEDENEIRIVATMGE